MKSISKDIKREKQGQTTLDFVFGISVFLITVSFVVLFLPGLITSFNTPSEDGNNIQAERTADHLVGSVLSGDQENTRDTALSQACTTAFFNTATNPPSQCGFTSALYENGRLDQTKLGLDKSTQIHIQLQSLNGTTEESVGEHPPASKNIQEWIRVVWVYGQRYNLRILVW